MAVLHGIIDSTYLETSMHFTAIIPETLDPQKASIPKPVLYLLHGYNGTELSWIHQTGIVRYAKEMNLAIIMPRMDNSFYTDFAMGRLYYSYLTKELPAKLQAMFNLSAKKEENYVAGLSMGGFGAGKWAFNEPNRFAYCAMLSAVIYPYETIAQRQGETAEGLAGFLHGMYGEKADYDKSNNVLEKIIDDGTQIDELYVAIGTEDFLYPSNIAIKGKLEKGSRRFTFVEEPGDHVWEFWDKHVQVVLKEIRELQDSDNV